MLDEMTAAMDRCTRPRQLTQQHHNLRGDAHEGDEVISVPSSLRQFEKHDLQNASDTIVTGVFFFQNAKVTIVSGAFFFQNASDTQYPGRCFFGLPRVDTFNYLANQ
jgi:hypothetical protein